MIEKMKVVHIVTTASEKTALLDRLRELGVAMRPAVKNNPVARSLLRALRRAAADDIA